ncbi:MAG: hypothetical protein ACE5Q6_17260, partial [Dehalococcoidia bacterium]
MSLIDWSGQQLVLVAVTLLLTLALSSCSQGFATGYLGHPMDPLTAEEYSAIIAALIENDYVDETGVYPLITLEEPAKDEVRQWEPGERVPRRAFVIVKKGPQTFEGVVDATSSKVLSWKEVEDVQPGLLPSAEWRFVQLIVRGNEEWRAAVSKRGIQSPRDVVCIPNPIGYYGVAE